MISAISTAFKYIDRGHRDPIVLIPGWATDYRIFDSLDLRFNYLLPTEFSPFTFKRDLDKALREKAIKKISLFGYSLGGFAACEFAWDSPEMVDELILVGIRKRYKTNELAQIKSHLKKNKRAYLYKFYSQCFLNKEKMRYFRKNLLKAYIEELDLDYLLSTLDYLSSFEIRPELLNSIRQIKIVHGREDKIAPIGEALEIKDNLPQAQFITIDGEGHIPFLKERFSEDISG